MWLQRDELFYRGNCAGGRGKGIVQSAIVLIPDKMISMDFSDLLYRRFHNEHVWKIGKENISDFGDFLITVREINYRKGTS